jgi:hypothetical protein
MGNQTLNPMTIPEGLFISWDLLFMDVIFDLYTNLMVISNVFVPHCTMLLLTELL